MLQSQTSLPGNSFQPTAKPSESKSGLDSRYLASRIEWDERFGEQVRRAKNWQSFALICGLSSLVAVSGVVFMSARSHVIPFVVVTDSLGRPVASGLAEQASTSDDQVKRATLIEWLENLRFVTTDGTAQRRAIDRVYAHLASASPAQTFISDFYKTNQPFVRAQTETVSVDVQSVLQNSGETFEIEWMETVRDQMGAIKMKYRWKGAFVIALNPPKDERLARINPLGIYVTQANWSRIL